MHKVDVAICSYKKPESLIYTILSLKEKCGDFIDTIYVDDDCSDDGTTDFYQESRFLEMIAPMKLKVRVNTQRIGYTKKVFTSKSASIQKRLFYSLFRRNSMFYVEDDNDVRYQWGINSTDKKYLFIIHDDIKFTGNIVKLYLESMEKDNKCAIVGDLGQCWRCNDSDKCNPDFITQGKRPHKYWPLTTPDAHNFPDFYERACRINEWCCMVDVDIAKKVLAEERCYFGVYEDRGDIGAYWFAKIVLLGYKFEDPLPYMDDRKKYYIHCWQGHSGHSVWVNQGTGTADYKREMIRSCLYEEFGYKLGY